VLNKRLKFNRSINFQPLATRIMDRRVLDGIFTLAVPACYVGPAIMVTADVVTIVLNHGHSPIRETISWFAAGPFGWLEKLGMLIVAISFLFIAVHLSRVKDYKINNKSEFRLLKLDGILLAIVAFGFLLITIINANVISTTVSFHGLIHQIATGFLLIKIPALKYTVFYSGLTFLVGIAGLFWLGFSVYRSDYLGLVERLIAGFNLVWIVLVGPQVIKLVNELR